MSGILQALLAGFGGAATDEYFKYVTMLLPGNGTNGAQNNTFLDSSTNNFTITRNGNTTQGTFSPYGSNWSNYFDGSGDYLTVGATTAINLSTDFTLEAWVYLNASTAYANIFSGSGNVNGGMIFEYSSSRGMYFYDNAGGDFTPGVGPLVGQWVHLAVTRSGSTLRMFQNGALVLTGTSSTNSSTYTYGIGAYNNGTSPINGYISNLRFVKGTALYTAAFTPPTSPLTAITNTSLLTCQSNRFIDNSTNALTITRNGDVSVQRFSPFSPTAPYAAGTDGGSGYFDGTGDYLNTPTTGQFAPAGDFTIAVWYYPTTLSTNNIVIANYTADLTTDWQINVTSTGSIEFYTNGNPIRISGGSVKAGAWNYIVLARSGSTLTGYLNGTSIGTYTQSGTFGSATKTIWVGSRPFSGSPLPITGYISDVKLIDGSAVTTVPTAPQTATTGTNLLLSFTNAGILDNAEMNNLETVGNAQISTAQSKFGGASIYFDGSGDALTAPPTVNLAMGTGDFTIEMWVYGANSGGAVGGAYPRIFQLGAAQTVNTIECYNAAGTMYVEMLGTSLSFTASTLLNSTWNHFAVTRAGTSLRAFVNGTQVGSTTSSNNLTSPITNTSFIGASTASSGNFSGYIDDLRITKGYARYTANFTAPTAPFPLS